MATDDLSFALVNERQTKPPTPPLGPPTPEELQRLAEARARAEAERREPIGREPDWDALAPRGAYARRVRPLLDLILLLPVLPVALALGLPVFLVNLAVFRDPRRVFFVQPRVGYRGRTFRIVKFRTMREPKTDSFSSWGGGDDRLRVTRFGRFLRNTHLDELPQVLNVLRGDMSFIGPRPEMVEVEEWARARIPGFSSRLAVKPGITGFAQITQGYTGRDVEAYTEKLRVNDRYRRELSLRLDLAILLRTAAWMARGRGWQWKEQGRRSASAD